MYFNDLATTVSVFYSGYNSGRFSYTYVNDLNQDGVNADLIYLPRNTADLNFTDIVSGGNVLFTAARQREAFDQFVEENGLEKHRGEYLGRNDFLMPWLNRFDFRLMRDLMVGLKGSQKLQFSLDIFNIGNLINKNWGIEKTLNNAQQLLNVTDVTPDGVPTFTMRTITENGVTVLPTTPFRNISTNSTTWNMQIGLRFIF